ncbi:hypothetical protein [Burkholderia sp. Ac-20365]|uniref:hypothetical protein n=1 Tax=Burkholderia sp. Ac-20365 TaxID=2703897 RepID=UPI00197C11C2|nr:hypothetical protein [Burkholderia sp. Ac-20365]MBN3761037.1 hypothetical protein [Burkholderia sp. Ac-20365]
MARKTSGRHSKSRHIPTKKELLPLPTNTVKEISLGYHLALVACRGLAGNQHLMNELTRALYLAFYLGELGYGHADNEFYRRVEAGLEAAINRGVADGVWQLTAEAAGSMEELLQLHDTQLGSARAGHVMEADKMLRRFLLSQSKASPFD